MHFPTFTTMLKSHSQALCGQFLSGLMATPDVYTGSGIDISAMSSLRKSFVGFAHAFRTGAGGAASSTAFVENAIGGMD